MSEANEVDGVVMRFTPITKIPHPMKEQFLAAWLCPDGEIDGIEWLIFDGECYWNLNSSNLNVFGEDGYPMFTHWMPVPLVA